MDHDKLMEEREDLETELKLLQDSTSRLKVENSVLLSYNEKKTVELGMEEDEKKKKKKKNVMNMLSIDHKIDIANVVHEDVVTEIENSRKNSEKLIDTLRAVLEETEIRIGELKRDAYEFKRDVVVGAENPRTGKIMAEKVTRYFDDKFRQTDGIIEKLRLKNSSLKAQVNKIEAQLSQKEEAGDVLHYIDFHQLQIENKQYVSKIEESNDELLTVKLSSSKTIQALNEYKRRLNLQTEDAAWLKNEVEVKTAMMLKIDGECKKVSKEILSEKRTKNKLRLQIEEANDMPDVNDYILLKKELYELDSAMKNWQKKVDIMEMAAKSTKRL